jgi:CheY-like chemotaxis protein
MDIRMPVMDGIKATEKILDFHKEMCATAAFKDRM